MQKIRKNLRAHSEILRCKRTDGRTEGRTDGRTDERMEQSKIQWALPLARMFKTESLFYPYFYVIRLKKEFTTVITVLTRANLKQCLTYTEIARFLSFKW